MGKYDGKVINITETRKYKDNGNVVKKEIKNILYGNKNGKEKVAKIVVVGTLVI